MGPRLAPFAILLAGCASGEPLDQPNPPPTWPLENVTDVQRSVPRETTDGRSKPASEATVEGATPAETEAAGVEPPAPTAEGDATAP